jgi:hypothetical protein
MIAVYTAKKEERTTRTYQIPEATRIIVIGDRTPVERAFHMPVLVAHMKSM